MQTTFIPSTFNLTTLAALFAHDDICWQVCFLQNNGHPVVGILPKTAWKIYPNAKHACQQTSQAVPLYIKKATRQSDKITEYSTNTSFGNQATLEAQLISYYEAYANPTDISDSPKYHHGLMGFMGYDLSANTLNPNICLKHDQLAGFFGHYDVMITQADDGFLVNFWGDNQVFFDTISQKITQLLTKILPPKTAIGLSPKWQRNDYHTAFYKTQDYLLSGDAYQINLTQCWQGLADNLHLHLPHLHQAMNAPFSGFMCIDGFELLSVSPELFFTFYRQNNACHITTKPIKGTRPRHNNQATDERLKAELASSEKDISENLMIVDLLRNDLGKYAKVGQVKTPIKFAIESFTNVHHMVSTITAVLKPDSHPISVLLGSLPAGSITGAPKKRACEIIHELESTQRGAYCGTLGYLNFDGTGQWNVLIRTLQSFQGVVELWAGGGITICSDVNAEYQECFDKVGKIIDLLKHESFNT
ncbi:anthranilate synthase component I family protein [Moraxella nasovis]|uniref:anthranilate synthase component I family protein n=1 Tax=Moraxella nasovis TaxID=2904121 RepID=UPI001F6250D0|nr:anthranilate synthase component I family protein [Moraxella nasovis]UNU74023.1 anthranilate synthase component I family protein [Moraxella nasovis]